MLVVASLGAVGATLLLRRLAGHLRVAVMLVITAVVVVDLWSVGSLPTTTIKVPSVISLLRREPPGTVAEYPLNPTGYGFYSDIFYEGFDGHPYLNGYDEGSVQETRALSLANLAGVYTPGDLAALGVRYVLVEANPAVVIGPPLPAKLGRGFRELGADSYGRLYKVTAAPLGVAIATPVLGLFGNAIAPTGAIVDIASTRSHSSGNLMIWLGSAPGSPPVTVTIVGPTGQTLLTRSFRVHAALRVPLRFNVSTSITIYPAPNSAVTLAGLSFVGG
jgi:hypothetical protein